MSLSAGDRLNLERCLPAGARLDGHVVQGHVDAMATLADRDHNDGRHRFSVDAHVASFIAEKGSIAVDGVSLTVTAVGEDDGTGENDTVWFEVGLIPTTLAETTLGDKQIGDGANIEVDVLAKYAWRMLNFDGQGTDNDADTARTDTARDDAALLAVPPPNTPAPILDPIEVALNQLAKGRPVVVVDDADRENEGDLIFPPRRRARS